MALPLSSRANSSAQSLLSMAGSVPGLGSGVIRPVVARAVSRPSEREPTKAAEGKGGSFSERLSGFGPLGSLTPTQQEILAGLSERKPVELSASDAVALREFLFRNLPRIEVDLLLGCFRSIHEKAPFSTPQQFQLVKRLDKPGRLLLCDEDVKLLMQFSCETGRAWDGLMTGLCGAFKNEEYPPELLHSAVLTAFKTDLTRSKILQSVLELKLAGKLSDRTWEVLRAETNLGSPQFVEHLSNALGCSGRWQAVPVNLPIAKRRDFLLELARLPWNGGAAVEKLALSIIEATHGSDSVAALLQQDMAFAALGIASDRYATRLGAELARREAPIGPARCQQLLELTATAGELTQSGSSWITHQYQSSVADLAQRTISPDEFEALSASLPCGATGIGLQIRRGFAAALSAAVVEQRVVVTSPQLTQFLLRASTLGGFSPRLFSSLESILSERLRIQNHAQEVLSPEAMLPLAELVARVPGCSAPFTHVVFQKSLVYVRALKATELVDLLWFWAASGREVPASFVSGCIDKLRDISHREQHDSKVYLRAQQAVLALPHPLLKSAPGFFADGIAFEHAPAMEQEDLAILRCHLREIDWGGTRYGVPVFLTAKVNGVPVALRESLSSQRDDSREAGVVARSMADLEDAIQIKVLERFKFQVLSANIPSGSSASERGSMMRRVLREWLYMGDTVAAEISWEKNQEPRVVDFD